MKAKRFFQFVSSGFFLCTTSFVLGGCRLPIGNKIEVDKEKIGLAGFYNTAPQSLKFCSSYKGADPASPNTVNVKCQNANPNQTPAQVASVMTNPVAYVPQMGEDTAVLVNKDLKGANFPVFTFKDNLEFALTYADTYALWLTGSCEMRSDIEINDGKVTVTNSEPKSTSEIRGRVGAEFVLTWTLQGACGSALLEMAACLKNINDCPNDPDIDKQTLRDWVDYHFGIWIDAGLMTVDDISTAKSVSFTVLYQ